MKTLAELEAERDRIQAMIDKGEYVHGIEAELDRSISRWIQGPEGRGELIAEFIAIARRHLLPIVTAGEAGNHEYGLAWDGTAWYSAWSANGTFRDGDNALTGITHWLPAARVPGPTQEPRP